MLALADTPAAQVAPASFRGTGNQMIGPFRVTQPSTGRWTSSGPLFQLSSTVNGSGNVNSTGHGGIVYLAPGTYRMQIRAGAPWTIQIVPGLEPPHRLPGGYVGFQGSGSTQLPPFTLARGVRIVWHAQGSLFGLADVSYSGPIRVMSRGPGSTATAGAGTHQVTVNTIGSWTIEWRP